MNKKQPRIRVCGLLLRQDRLLMVRIQPPTRNYPVWMPPGGQLQYGEMLKEGVRREFHEETQLNVQVEHLVFIHQFIEAPFHALEFYFYCIDKDNTKSPEIAEPPENMGGKEVLIDIDFISMQNLSNLDMEPVHLMNFNSQGIIKPSTENLTLYSTF